MVQLTPGSITVAPDATASGTSNLSTVSFLQPTSFKLLIERKHFPNLEFFAQQVLHPGMQLNATEVPYQRASIALPGDKLTFGEVTCNIIIDEDLNAYTEMFNWMKRLVENKHKSPSDLLRENKPPVSADITVMVLSNHNNTTRQIKYIDCVPTLLGDISFETTSGEQEYLIFPASFKFSYFEIRTQT